MKKTVSYMGEEIQYEAFFLNPGEGWGEASLNKVAAAGGFGVGYATKAEIDAAAQAGLLSSEEIQTAERILATGEGWKLFVLEPFYKKLGKHSDVLIEHEIGHIVHQHYFRSQESDKLNGYLINTQFELEADAYAAAKYGKIAVREALDSVLMLMVEYFAYVAPQKNKEEWTQALYGDQGIIERFRALQ